MHRGAKKICFLVNPVSGGRDKTASLSDRRFGFVMKYSYIGGKTLIPYLNVLAPPFYR